MIAEFGLGMILGAVWPRLPSSRRWVWPAALCGALALGLMIAGRSLYPQLERTLMFGLPAAVVVGASLILERAQVAVPWPWLRRLGDASYATYLTHFFVTQAIVLAAARLAIQGWLPALALGACAFAGAALTGLAVHFGVERTLEQAIRALAARRRPRQYA